MHLTKRPRRLRRSAPLRQMVQETKFAPSQLIFPLFVTEGKGIDSSHKDVPGIRTLSIDKLGPAIKKLQDLQIPSVLLFGVSGKKDARGSEALKKDGPVVLAIKEIREKFPEMLVATDIALDPYTDHGHDGLFEGGEIVNDATIEVLAEMSILHATAGAQIVAPSDMMDGRVGGIRKALDDEGHSGTSILAYTAKYASSLYGPFRETLSAKVTGDKKTYQMNPANRREALRELKLDIKEGADMVMVKPASWYLDIISDFKKQSSVPVVAYQVSGECAMIEAGVRAGFFARERAICESTVSIFRAGADLLVTYFAEDIARLALDRKK